MRTEYGGPMGKCVTPGCPVHIYPGPVCSDCGMEPVPLTDWRRETDAILSREMAYVLGRLPCRTDGAS